MTLDVLLTDGGYKNTYAILRSLKVKNLKVGVIFNSVFSLSYFSRLVDKRFMVKSNILKNPNEKEMELFKKEIKNILTQHKISVLLPVSNVSCRFASIYKDELSTHIKIPVVDADTLKIAQDKTKTFEYAREQNVPVPKTFYLNPEDEIEGLPGFVSFPCVIKKTNFFEGGVKYCNNKSELMTSLDKILEKKKQDSSFPVIQEYVNGPGFGYYGVYKEGECLAYFMHQRIHEYPVTGGASSLAKSIYNERLHELGDLLLRNLKWTGVAMVEFKKDINKNEFILMEINPKFWGSYELGFKSGINFAYIDYLLALNKDIPDNCSDYKKDIHFRWILPDDMLWNAFSSEEQKKSFKELKKNVKIYNNIHWKDPGPIIFNAGLTLFKLFRDKKNPHGKIN